MSNKFFKIIVKPFLAFALLAGFVLPVFNYFGVSAQTAQEERETLESELRALEAELRGIEGDIEKTEAEKKTLQNDIYLLKRKIQGLDVQIRQSNAMITDLGIQIEDTEFSIEKTTSKMDDAQARLSAVLRRIDQEDKKSLIEILLSENDLSDFFQDLAALEFLSNEGKDLLAEVKSLKSSLEGQKQSLDDEKMDLEKIVQVRMLQKQQNSVLQNQQEGLLKLTEAEYQKQLQQKQETEKKASEIRARIFQLIGVPKAPTFGEAYEIAKYVSGVTGVRPALLLAVLTQESNIGKNVGQCYLIDTASGQGKRITTGAIEAKTMNPTRDLPVFLEITGKLGRDPLNTPVSCPMSIGWGGAMGPAQFIPATWNMYDEKIKAVTGKEPDPWDIRDAFLASGTYLKDLGASSNEFKAVMRYFSGYSWSKWEEFYGRSVLALAQGYEADIKQLEGN